MTEINCATSTPPHPQLTFTPCYQVRQSDDMRSFRRHSIVLRDVKSILDISLTSFGQRLNRLATLYIPRLYTGSLVIPQRKDAGKQFARSLRDISANHAVRAHRRRREYSDGLYYKG